MGEYLILADTVNMLFDCVDLGIMYEGAQFNPSFCLPVSFTWSFTDEQFLSGC